MLLRSLTKHVKDQNWFAVFLDFFIVVAGILIAFQITNWSDGRQDRAEEYQALNALKDNISITASDLDKAIGEIEIGNGSLKLLAEYSDGNHDDLSIAELDQHILFGVYNLPGFEPTMVTYDELRNTGRLGLISNVILRNNLQAFSKNIESLKSDEAGLAKMSYETADPFLLKNVDWRGFAQTTGLTRVQTPNSLNWIDPAKNRSDYKTILRNREFQNLVIYRGRLNGAYLGSARVLGASLDELEQLIDTRLAEFGRN